MTLPARFDAEDVDLLTLVEFATADLRHRMADLAVAAPVRGVVEPCTLEPNGGNAKGGDDHFWRFAILWLVLLQRLDVVTFPTIGLDNCQAARGQGVESRGIRL